MDSIPELDGVYVWIKDYEFEKLRSFIEKHQDDLMKLDSWKRLYDIAKRNKDKTGAFKENGTINVEEYLKTDFNKLPDKKQGDKGASDPQGAASGGSGNKKRSSDNKSQSTDKKGSNSQGTSDAKTNQKDNTQ